MKRTLSFSVIVNAAFMALATSWVDALDNTRRYRGAEQS